MSEHEEYTAETYPSFGKKYNGEKAIISLTSWTARINTVAKTLYSLVKMCPGFHIVLVLSEEEFPKMMDELPDNLKLFVDNELIEVLWVYKNYRSFKKWIFTSQKYPDIPVISADDDCIYTCNYAQMLYDVWVNNKNCCVSNCSHKIASYNMPNGYATLYVPMLGQFIQTKLNETVLSTNNDDSLTAFILNKLHINIKYINKNIAVFHDEISAMGANGMYVRGSSVFSILQSLFQ